MKSPIIKVFIKSSKRDISERVEKLRFEDCVKEDDLVEVDIKAGYAFQTADDDDIVAGTIIQFQFGFAGEVLSEVHEARITDVEVTYGTRITMKIKATDIGAIMKKSSSIKVWSKMTSTQIAQEIAARYKLIAVVDDTSKVWDTLPQGNKSDFKFLNELADKEESGDYMFFIRSGKLYFVKRGIEKGAMLKFKYGEAGVISFAPKYRETTASNATNSTKTVAVDGKTKKTITSSSKDIKKEETVLGPKIIYVDVNNEKLK